MKSSISKLGKRLVRSIFHRFGLEISLFHKDQPGLDPFQDIARRLCGRPEPVIFDVGAHKGESITRFKKVIPGCKIHAFEPGPIAFESLEKNTKSMDGVVLNNFALGQRVGPKTFYEHSRTDMSSALRLSTDSWSYAINKSLVAMSTMDQYCLDKNIPLIDVVKIDTQGFDLEVIKGASALLDQSRIFLVLTEIIFSDMYKDLPKVTEVFELLDSHAFRLVTIYPFHYQGGLASWTDALFLNTHLSREEKTIGQCPPSDD